MSTRVIVITSGKGGVGKTTSTANIAAALAKFGKKVVAVDADVGLRNLDVIMGLENRVVYNFIDVIEKTARLEAALVRDKRVPGLYLLPAAQTRTKDAVNQEQMIELCEQLKNFEVQDEQTGAISHFDFILLDCPAGIESGFKNAAVGADEALVVTTPEIPAVRDADRIIGMLESMGKSPIRLIINRLRPNMVQDGDMLAKEDILDVLAIKLIGIVPEDETVIKSTNNGEPMTLSIASPAAQAYLNIADRLIGNDVPLMDLQAYASRGFMQWLKDLFRGKKRR
ncbi:MAG: septum site-determining protein MinD [Synergistaceae bacterium]|nr:septum site-determining protein MinD [Synergistaceae bacterium]MBQ6740364.1 septum site-determining protein MinD [Synergistaceae bacterium]MBQ7569338.1 septum site-determining protein MinD [Synergistaceae bacterium]MBR0044202.1 septum site-determining protein MinD [Synergistaceae bacterium]MBR0097531.1 septum site-determining protein MinD [Synergistaceae bacterium]